MLRLILVLSVVLVPACARLAPILEPALGPAPAAEPSPPLYPGETIEMRRLIEASAEEHQIPESLLHRVIQRESDYRAHLRAGPYYGLMQILPATARTMGFEGSPERLLDPVANLRYAGRYLRGAWLISDGDEHAAMMHYARGYYYAARDRCMLVETRLAEREIARHCR